MAGVLFMHSKMERLMEEKGLRFWDDCDRYIRHIVTDIPLTFGERAFVDDYMSVLTRGFTIEFDEINKE